MDVTLTVNGRREQVEVGPAETLLGMLRERLRLTGTKEGCNEGECGACTVLVDGLPVDSCIYSAAATSGRSVETVEGLADDDLGRDLQAAFVAAGGVQCGFCTPGFLTTLVAVLRENPEPSEPELREALAGNICRCTGYSQILDAVAATISGRNRR
ncbi:MAG: (2Fe-2S)-binding protein [Pseudonocardia sp.]|uniref:(2Fe-2S)-binding protein n=1 Tax=unclassified Pseudonocardia TaxID=2619320 RepID=UPI00086D3629|nr:MULTISPECIES: (2Fe-2S)-binding protein [unclassified Pseudonocardia]MBN9111598.1 (2Fe-2S)-binding protein [Pseudonocardia sp.]ODU26495.1 MAG: (2Fe-2S)-binding protein [Pseudonocardia sp. SCN 72-51]ODU98188.1 MAG: (2Fe-2S)-binding protein [Pseudonocardia sp. SCN 73-27]